MVATKTLMIGLLVVSLLIVGCVAIYNLPQQDIKYCDSSSIVSGNSNEPICYEEPTGFGTKLKPLTK